MGATFSKYNSKNFHVECYMFAFAPKDQTYEVKGTS